MSQRHKPNNIVIIGGGIVGVSTAYFLATSPNRPPRSTITIIEGTSIAAAASGYSGGFLARDWHGPATSSLSALSFDLHRKLALQLNGAKHWGYRPVDTLSVTIDETAQSSSLRSPVSWLPRGRVHSTSVIGTQDTTAQVHPRLLTQYLADRFVKRPGCSIVLGTVTALALDTHGCPSSVLVSLREGGTDTIIECDTVVLAAGPWLGKVANDLLPSSSARGLACGGQMAHSLVFRTSEPTSAHVLFCDLTLEDGAVSEPEVYPRPDGTTLVCGASCDTPVPASAAEVIPDSGSLAKLRAQAQGISPIFTPNAGAVLEASTGCFLPIPDRGRPIVGKVRGVEGVYVGGGHSCWGITQGPGTGLVLSELVWEGKVHSADISQLSP